jgi:hypothetical protein
MPVRLGYSELKRKKILVPFKKLYAALLSKQKEITNMPNIFNKVQRAQWEELILELIKKEALTQEQFLMIQANKHIVQLERELTGQKKICVLLNKEVKGL